MVKVNNDNFRKTLPDCAEKIVEIVENGSVDIKVDREYDIVHYSIELDDLGYDFSELQPEDLEEFFVELEDEITEILKMRSDAYDDFSSNEDDESDEYRYHEEDYDYDYDEEIDEDYDYQAELEAFQEQQAWEAERAKRAGYHLDATHLYVPARGEGDEYLA